MTGFGVREREERDNPVGLAEWLGTRSQNGCLGFD